MLQGLNYRVVTEKCGQMTSGQKSVYIYNWEKRLKANRNVIVCCNVCEEKISQQSQQIDLMQCIT